MSKRNTSNVYFLLELNSLYHHCQIQGGKDFCKRASPTMKAELIELNAGCAAELLEGKKLAGELANIFILSTTLCKTHLTMCLISMSVPYWSTNVQVT